MNALIIQQTALFDNIINQVEKSVESAESGRVYRQTLQAWARWSNANEHSPMDLTYAAVTTYLDSLNVGKQTKQRQLSALRKAARVIASVTGDDRPVQQLTLLKIQRDENKGRERNKIALTQKQVYMAFDVWLHDTLIDRRNTAILAVLFYAGLRRSEVASLKWTDFDLDAGIITVRHGKGDKEREAAIVGNSGIEAVQDWKTAQTAANGGIERVYAFSEIRKGGHLQADKPMTADAIWRIVKKTGEMIDVDFAPHDARRTLATDALASGTPVSDMQAQLGHSQATTTLRYAQKADAKVRRARMKIGY
jgi:integrase